MNAFEFAVDTAPSYTNPFWRKEGASHSQSIANALHYPRMRASPSSSTLPLSLALDQIHATQQHIAVLNQPPRHSMLLCREDSESAYGPSRPESHRATSHPNTNTNYDNHTNRLNKSPSPAYNSPISDAYISELEAQWEFSPRESADQESHVRTEYDDGARSVQPSQSAKYPEGEDSDSPQGDNLQEASHDYDELVDQFLANYSPPPTALSKPAANSGGDKPLSTNTSPQHAQQQPLSIHCPRPLRPTSWNTEAVPAYIQSSPTIAPPQYRLPSQVIQPAHNDTCQLPNLPVPYQYQAGSATHHGEAEPLQPNGSNRAPITGNCARFETRLIEQDWNGVVTSDGSCMQETNEARSRTPVQPRPGVYPPVVQLTEHHPSAQLSNKRNDETEITSETSSSIELQRPTKRSRTSPSSDSALSSNTPTPPQGIVQKRKKVRRIGREKIGDGFILQRDLRQARELIHVAETVSAARKVLECADNECEMEDTM